MEVGAHGSTRGVHANHFNSTNVDPNGRSWKTPTEEEQAKNSKFGSKKHAFDTETSEYGSYLKAGPPESDGGKLKFF